MKTLSALVLALPLMACGGEPFQPRETPPADTGELISKGPAPMTYSLCGDELREAIAQASDGLLWPSESDEPIAPLVVPLGDDASLDEARLLALLALPPDTPAETRGLAPLARLGREADDMSPEERVQAERFRALRAVLESNLTGVTSYYLGKIQVRVLIVGRSRCGELAGFESLAIET